MQLALKQAAKIKPVLHSMFYEPGESLAGKFSAFKSCQKCQVENLVNAATTSLFPGN